MNDERYTLAEAEQELRRRRCATEGHFYDVLVVTGANAPEAIICTRCGETWAVAKEAT